MFFVIGFVGRVGSSYLEGLLNSHPEVKCSGEILSGKWVRNAQESCRKRLDRLVHNSAERAVGFKLALAHIQAHGDVVNILSDHGYKVIHLTRRNRIDQYISMRLAQINGIWRSDIGTYTIHSFKADPQQLQASINTFVNNDNKLAELLQPLPLMTIAYEDLVSGTWRDQTLEYLDVPPCDMHSPFVRQRSATKQRDALENYDEIARHFRGAEIEKFLVD